MTFKQYKEGDFKIKILNFQGADQESPMMNYKDTDYERSHGTLSNPWYTECANTVDIDEFNLI